LLIDADCGGSNGNRSRVWKVGLQHLANEFGLIITVIHYPTGASKWNPIEHRMFSLISANWAGEPLDSYETILKHIRSTTSTTGFGCYAELDTTIYETNKKVSDRNFALGLCNHTGTSLIGITPSTRNHLNLLSKCTSYFFTNT